METYYGLSVQFLGRPERILGDLYACWEDAMYKFNLEYASIQTRAKYDETVEYTHSIRKALDDVKLTIKNNDGTWSFVRIRIKEYEVKELA